MAYPYVSSRSGRFAWMMQRVTAILLLFLAFSHFALQHFTPAAVSTGLTVTARMNDHLWQTYYILFVVLALYHGTNGLVGIMQDYAPKQLTRNIGAFLLWTLAAVFGVLGIVNILGAKSLPEAKNWYAMHGFGVGTSSGSPPSFTYNYDIQKKEAEEAMLQFYWQHHVDRKPDDAPVDLFTNGHDFDSWASRTITTTIPRLLDDHQRAIFASPQEFALWAQHVRRANARSRSENPEAVDPAPDRTLYQRLGDLPPYDAHRY